MSGAGSSVVFIRAPLAFAQGRHPTLSLGKRTAGASGPAPTFPAAGGFKGPGSPTKAAIPSCPRSSRLFRKIGHSVSAVVHQPVLPVRSRRSPLLPSLLQGQRLKTRGGCQARELAPTSGTPPPPQLSPSPFVFKKSRLLPLFSALKGPVHRRLSESSAGRMLKRPASYPVPLQTKSLGPESDMSYERPQSRLPVKAGLEPRPLTLKPVFFLWSDLNKIQWRREPSLVLSFVSPALYPEIPHLGNNHTCLFGLNKNWVQTVVGGGLVWVSVCLAKGNVAGLLGSFLAARVPALWLLGSGQLPARAKNKSTDRLAGLPGAGATLVALLLTEPLLKSPGKSGSQTCLSLEVLTALSWGSPLWLPIRGDLTVLSPPETGLRKKLFGWGPPGRGLTRVGPAGGSCVQPWIQTDAPFVLAPLPAPLQL